MILGGGNTYETGTDAIDSTDEIDLQEEHPEWKKGPNLPRGKLDNGELGPESAGKMYVSAVALPDATCLRPVARCCPAPKTCMRPRSLTRSRICSRRSPRSRWP